MIARDPYSSLMRVSAQIPPYRAISTRRFIRRPSSVSLLVIGRMKAGASDTIPLLPRMVGEYVLTGYKLNAMPIKEGRLIKSAQW